MPFAMMPIRQLGSRSCARSIWARSPRRAYSSQPQPPPSPSGQQTPTPASDVKTTSPPAPVPAPAPSPYLRPAVRFFKWYRHHERHSPHTTQLWITPLIYLAGDLSAQLITGDDYDPARALRAVLVGTVVAVPSYRWLMLLSRHFNYSSTALSTAARVGVNQLVFAPVFNVYFFSAHALLEGEGAEGAVERVASAVPKSIPRSCLYWPLVTAFAFTYVRPHSRAAVVGLFTIAWQSYLSWLNRRTERREPGGTAGMVLDTGS